MKNELKRVLVAEDEMAYSRALILKLQHAGFDAQSVPDGEKAIELLKQERFDLLLLDLIMPKMNGFLVLESLEKLGIKQPTFVLSNLAQEEDKKKAMSLGALKFIPKSDTSIVDVINEVKILLGQ
jgi:two-component system, OmpR family, alkaline phosphatase synthesis response regulator PhoP